MPYYQKEKAINSLRGEDGKIMNIGILTIAEKGLGKTTAREYFRQKFFMNGRKIIVFDDFKKGAFEACYAMFEIDPTNQIFKPSAYQLRLIRKWWGRDKSQKFKVKILHPFTFAIPKNKKVPPIKLFTIPISKLSRQCWMMFAEARDDSRIVTMIMEAQKRLKSNEGVHELGFYADILNKVQKTSMEGVSIVKRSKPFYTTVASTGSQKDVEDITSYFKLFMKEENKKNIGDYFLASDDCPLNLDVARELLDNQDEIVYISFHWIKDYKIRYFCMMAVIDLLNQALEDPFIKKKYPLVLEFPETLGLLPEKYTAGYQEFLSGFLTETLLGIRNAGKGVSLLGDSQSLRLLSKSIKTVFNMRLIGKITNDDDLDWMQKSLGWKSETRDMVKNLKHGQFIEIGRERYGLSSVYCYPPPLHCHAEAEYDFFEMFHKIYETQEVTFNETIDLMNEWYAKAEKHIEEMAAKIDKTEITEKVEKRARKEQAERLMLEKEELEKKLGINKDEQRKAMMKRCYDLMRQPFLPNGDKTTIRGIAKYLTTETNKEWNHKTVSNYIEKYKESLVSEAEASS